MTYLLRLANLKNKLAGNKSVDVNGIDYIEYEAETGTVNIKFKWDDVIVKIHGVNTKKLEHLQRILSFVNKSLEEHLQ